MKQRFERGYLLALLVAAAALMQWLLLLNRAVHAATLWWKVGDGRLTTGMASLAIFVGVSLAFALLGWRAVTLLSAHPSRRRMARIASFALLGGVIGWAVAIVSPAVQLVPR
jgi:hypothetical protein